MLALSTTWNSHRYTDGEALLSELRTLGITGVEVAPGTKISLLPGFRRVLKTGRANVISVGNFCPLPIDPKGVGVLRCELTSPNPAWRERAIHWTKITIDYAAGLEASYVVLRLGGTAMQGFTAELYRQVRSGGLHSRRFVTEKLRGIRERARESGPWMTRAKATLDVLLPYAASKGVRLAILGTGNYEEGPTETEMLELLQSVGKGGALGYWHDFSQTQKKANLGLLDHAEWLQEIRPHLLGCHLNDLRWPDETGCVPLSGMIDFDRLIPLLPPQTPLIWNVNPRCRAAELRQMVPVWEERFLKGAKAR